MLVENPKGNYLFVPGGDAFSNGVVSAVGHEIVRVTFKELVPWRQGFEFIDAYLAKRGRPRQALCTVEIRCAQPFSAEGFSDFNRDYYSLLADWQILVENRNPMARTNVAPVLNPPTETSLFAFAYTALIQEEQRSTFVASGSAEITQSAQGEPVVIRPGETSGEAIKEKNEGVMKILSGRLDELEQEWSQITTATIYTVRNIHPFLEDGILSKMGTASLRGVQWQYASPPLVGLDYEVDFRGLGREIYL